MGLRNRIHGVSEPETRSVSFTLAIPPVGKKRPRTFWHERHGRIMTITPRETKLYEEVGWAAKAAGLRLGLLQPPHQLRVRVLFQDARRRDVDNVLKTIADALNGIAWDDDAQVCEMSAVNGGIDPNIPRVEVTVSGQESP